MAKTVVIVPAVRATRPLSEPDQDHEFDMNNLFDVLEKDNEDLTTSYYDQPGRLAKNCTKGMKDVADEFESNRNAQEILPEMYIEMKVT